MINDGSATEQRGTKKGEDGKNNDINTPLVIGNPFSDTRSLRGMVDAYQRADALLSMLYL